MIVGNRHFIGKPATTYAGIMDILGHEENIKSPEDRSFVGHII